MSGATIAMSFLIGAAGALRDSWMSIWSRPSSGALNAVAGKLPAIVVTGGSSGIGLAIARRFADADRELRVLLVARGRDRLEHAASGFADNAGHRIATLSLDVTNKDAADRIEAALAERGWYLDTLVNAAGMGLSGPFTSQPAAEIERLAALNVIALSMLTRHALPPMIARNRGGVINIASLGGYVPGPYQAAYYASKAYVCSLSTALHDELSGTAVRLTAVAPGPVETGFHAAMGAEGTLYRRVLPAMSPERVAAAAWAGYRLGRTVVVPGVLPRILAVAVSILPHWMTVPVVRLLLWRR